MSAAADVLRLRPGALRKLYDALDEHDCSPRWLDGGRGIVARCPCSTVEEPHDITVLVLDDDEEPS